MRKDTQKKKNKKTKHAGRDKHMRAYVFHIFLGGKMASAALLFGSAFRRCALCGNILVGRRVGGRGLMWIDIFH